ncbi:uncharacterized protein LOC131991705 [Centropristis striata]|uniref:uncharacterized protein LOC131991705 n=1 Tax=Centropristis striata TaxID=184440 RepID=UPI0027E17F5E|nr:uncharacterized protein LOC131991705 [Centropristis striata]
MEHKLIVAVSGCPSLYDSNCPTYRDLNMRAESWRRVSQLVGVPEAECRRKWKTLRDQHRRERQREKDRRESGIGLFNYRPWRYSAILSFLNPFIDARAAGCNGWALDPQPSQAYASEMGCSTTTEPRSDEDDSYDISIADATTTTCSEFVQRKRSSSVSGDLVRFKEAKMEVTAEPAAARDDVVQLQHDNMKELFEMMMQSVTSLAATLASSHSSSQPSVDQLMAPAQSMAAAAAAAAGAELHRGLLPPCAASRLHHLKTEEAEPDVVELLDGSDEDDECTAGAAAASPRPTRGRRRTGDVLLEEYLRRMESRDVQRERDLEQRDDVALFLLSLAPALRRLSAERQSWLRTRIQQLVHQAEFGPATATNAASTPGSAFL